MSVVIVTGGAGGIGRVVARELVGAGWSVVVAAREQAEADEVTALLGCGALGVALDVRDPASWERAVHVARGVGDVTGLVNGAAVLGPGGVLDVDDEVFADVLDVNVRGCLLGLRAVAPAMEAAGGGSVVNVGSSVAMAGTPGLAAYGASKWALRGLTRTAAIELGPLGMRVNAVLPGSVATALVAVDSPGRDAWFRALPGGRQGVPEDVAAATAYLLSPDSAYVTGAELTVDGGMTARADLPPR